MDEQKRSQLRAVSEEVVAAFDEARQQLSTCWVDGQGILADRSDAARRLRDAKASIDAALAALDSVKDWPSRDELYPDG